MDRFQRPSSTIQKVRLQGFPKQFVFTIHTKEEDFVSPGAIPRPSRIPNHKASFVPTQLNRNWECQSQLKKHFAVSESLSRLLDTEKLLQPSSYVGLIVSVDIKNKKLCNGVGILISKNVVLTSFDCLYDYSRKRDYKNVYFIMGYKQYKCSGVYKSSDWRYSPLNILGSTAYQGYSFGVIFLGQNVGETRYGYASIDVSLEAIQDPESCMVGYQIDSQYRARYFQKKNMFREESDISEKDLQAILPGSVCLRKIQGNYVITGIITSQKNIIWLSNGIVLELLNKWIRPRVSTILSCDLLPKNAQTSYSSGQKSTTEIISFDLRGCSEIIKCKKDLLAFLIEHKWRDLRFLKIAFRKIDLFDEYLVSQDIKHIMLGKWESLRSLDLSDNRIQDQGTRTICESNLNLSHLNLSNSTESFFNFIYKLNKSLEANQLTYRSIQLIISSRLPDTLEILIMNANPIQDEGVRKLVKASYRFKRLVKLGLEHIQTSQNQMMQALSRLQINTLQSLEIGTVFSYYSILKSTQDITNFLVTANQIF